MRFCSSSSRDKPRINTIWLNSFYERFCIFAIFFNPFLNYLSFFTFTSAFFCRSSFFLICLILFLNIFFNIFRIFLVRENFFLCPCFTCILPIRVNTFFNLDFFRLPQVYLAISLFLYWYAQFHYFALHLAYLYYARKKINFLIILWVSW